MVKYLKEYIDFCYDIVEHEDVSKQNINTIEQWVESKGYVSSSNIINFNVNNRIIHCLCTKQLCKHLSELNNEAELSTGHTSYVISGFYDNCIKVTNVIVTINEKEVINFFNY